MRVNGIKRIEQVQAGITRVSSEVEPAELVLLIQDLAGRRALPVIPSTQVASGIMNVKGESSDVEYIVRMSHVTPESFQQFYNSQPDKAVFRAPLAGQRAETLISFLMDQGVRSLSTLSKDDMVREIVKNPRTLYAALAGIVRGQTIVTDNCQSLAVGERTALVYRAHGSNIGARRLDFWEANWTEGADVRSIEFTSRCTAEEFQGIPSTASVNIRWRHVKAPSVEFQGATIDIADKKLQEIAEELGVARANERGAMLDRVLASRTSTALAEKYKGRRMYFSFDGPIAIGQPLTQDELLGLARFIEVKGSAKVDDKNVEHIFEAYVVAGQTRTQGFPHYFKAKPKVWAVFADVDL